jgi:hypothetical protein
MRQHTMQPSSGAQFQQSETVKFGAPTAPDSAPLSHERVRELLGWNLLHAMPDQRSGA